MRSLNLFLPYVTPHVIGAPEPDIKRALLSAMIEFCYGADVVQEIAPISASADEGDYDVEVPNQAQVVRVLAVMYNTRELRLVPTVDVRLALALRGSVGTSTPESNEPNYAYFKTPTGSVFSVYPLPAEDAVDALTVKASFAPTRSATQVADILYDDYAEDIAEGAISILQAIPGMPFSSATATGHRMNFVFAMAKARTDARRGRVVGTTQVQMRPFA